MSVHAHNPPATKQTPPPSVQRRCAAYTNPRGGGMWDKRDEQGRVVRDKHGLAVREWRDHKVEQCNMTASPWLPEADYCATHLPASAVLIVRERQKTWGTLIADMWAQTLAEHPWRPEQ